MATTEQNEKSFEVVCPSCRARLKVDAEFGKVLSHESPPQQAKTPDLERATRLLEKAAERREAIFKQSVEEEKIKTRLLDRKFEEALKKTENELVTPPIRDIDLD